MIQKKWNVREIKREQWILLLFVGILIMTAVVPAERRSETKKSTYEDLLKTDGQGEDTGTSENWDGYEKKLEELLSQMEGAGKVKVMITTVSGAESIVEKDQPYTIQMTQQGEEDTVKSQQENREETTVFEKDSQGNEKPYVTKTLAPQIEGVLVLAQGGDHAVVAQKITEAVMALFGIEAHKIKVMKMI